MSARLAVAVAISLGAAMAADQAEISYRECSGNYADGSQYANNLADLLSALPRRAASSSSTAGWFGTGTAGTASGLVMCYADCDAARCHDFLQKAADPAPGGGGLTAICPHSRNANLLECSSDGCLRVLRYAGAPFLGAADTSAAFSWQSSGDSDPIPAADVAGMSAARLRLLSLLAEKAAGHGQDQPPPRLATGSQAYAAAGAGGGSAPSQGVVYGLAQCTGDLAASECARCLAYLLAVASGDDGMGNATRGSVRGFSCYLRYQVNEPIDIGSSAAPSPQPTADQSGPAAAPWTGSTMTTRIAGLAAAASCVVLLAFGV
ncbi:unnamed protein product [Urochloa decumbens]|uniref:Gnk2-homologous domain-containing protein n=1 Tax=Urochloa decumbens TaxID=240449 RepID=A0ABC8X8R2_9POAL